MDYRGSNSGNIGLRRVTLKELDPDFDNILIVGIIIGKKSARKFAERYKESEQYKAVWGFTLRDTPRDYINVVFWGPSDEVFAASEKFNMGDVVEIRNPRINVRKFNEANEQYSPLVTSPFALTLTENSQVFPYNGDVFSFTKLLNFPTKPLSGYVPLRDINNGGETMKDRVIDILGAVRTVGPVKDIKTKTGQDMQMREIVLFDHTSVALRVALWTTEIVMRAATWKPRTTILFITDTKIVWSGFLNTYTASVTGRSIITENPIGKEAASLTIYAKNTPLEAVDILDQFIMTLPDPETIQNVMCVQQVRTKIENFLQKKYSAEPQLTALMYVVVTQLDLDGLSPTTRVKCSCCRSAVKSIPALCENPDCPSVIGTAARSLDSSFEIKVNLSDHTGTLANCRLSGAVAEQVLDCSVHQYLRMSNDLKRRLKWNYLMERCAVRIVVLLSNTFFPRISIVSCSRANPLETAQRIPLC